MCMTRFWNNLGALRTNVTESQITQKYLGARKQKNLNKIGKIN